MLNDGKTTRKICRTLIVFLIIVSTISLATAESPPEADLIAPDDGEYFREVPVNVLHEFEIPESEETIEFNVVIDDETVFSGSTNGDTYAHTKSYDEEDEGKIEWYVNTTFEDNEEEVQSEVRKYNVGDEDVAEGRAVDKFVNYVAELLGATETGAGLMISLTVASLFALMVAVSSVPYGILTFALVFLTMGFVGFLPRIFQIVLFVLASLIGTYYAYRLWSGDA